MVDDWLDSRAGLKGLGGSVELAVTGSVPVGGADDGDHLSRLDVNRRHRDVIGSGFGEFFIGFNECRFGRLLGADVEGGGDFPTAHTDGFFGADAVDILVAELVLELLADGGNEMWRLDVGELGLGRADL